MEPTLYILARTDIPDLNPGKLAAQSAHAQADFDQYIKTNPNSDYYKLGNAYLEWIDDRTFGRTLVLEANIEDLNLLTELFTHSGQTTDPTYPWRNFYGELKLSNIVTCGWIFAFDGSDTPESMLALAKLPLYR